MSGSRPGTLLALVLLGWGGPRVASAQEVSASPHGPLPDSLSCGSCHTTRAWSPLRNDLRFDHTGTGFALDGAHASTACVTCHEGLRFDIPKVDAGDCGSCHTDVHRGAFVQPCAACHTTTSFDALRAGIVHPADFPLEGAHLQTSCESCHTDDVGGAFTPLSTDCLSCHRSDYRRTVLVDHVALGFSSECTECHSMLAWRDVTGFDHTAVSGGFELTGAHARIDCRSCHSLPGGGVPSTPAGAGDCIACHQADYNEQHAGSGFPTDCTMCHRLTTWGAARFDHDAKFFPIYSGKHRSAWSSCADCHQVPADFATFTCLSCHEHERTRMDDEHREVAGYVYDSPSCLSCHPNGGD